MAGSFGQLSAWEGYLLVLPGKAGTEGSPAWVVTGNKGGACGAFNWTFLLTRNSAQRSRQQHTLERHQHTGGN